MKIPPGVAGGICLTAPHEILFLLVIYLKTTNDVPVGSPVLGEEYLRTERLYQHKPNQTIADFQCFGRKVHFTL